MIPLIKKLVQMVKIVMSLVPMVQMLPTNGTIGRTHAMIVMASFFLFQQSAYICEIKSADQLCSDCTADQRLCFRYPDSTIPFLLKSKLLSTNVTYVTHIENHL